MAGSVGAAPARSPNIVASRSSRLSASRQLTGLSRLLQVGHQLPQERGDQRSGALGAGHRADQDLVDRGRRQPEAVAGEHQEGHLVRLAERHGVRAAAVVDGEVTRAEQRLTALLGEPAGATGEQADLVVRRVPHGDHAPGPRRQVGAGVNPRDQHLAELPARHLAAERLPADLGALQRDEGGRDPVAPLREPVSLGHVLGPEEISHRHLLGFLPGPLPRTAMFAHRTLVRKAHSQRRYEPEINPDPGQVATNPGRRPAMASINRAARSAFPRRTGRGYRVTATGAPALRIAWRCAPSEPHPRGSRPRSVPG